MPTNQQLAEEIIKIKERNAKVEADKAWETSTFRKVLLAVLTYIVIVIFFYFADLQKPLINAIVPTLGFLISTFSIATIKNLWIKYRYKQDNNLITFPDDQ